jgi:alpha-glucoside transport system permease protein
MSTPTTDRDSDQLPSVAAAGGTGGGIGSTPAKTGRGGAMKSRRTGGSILPKLLLAFLCLLWTIPTIGLLVTSLRTRDAANTSGWWQGINPFSEAFGGWTLSNYDQVINGNDMGNAFLNSLIISIPATVIPIMFAAFAAYAFSFMKFPGRDTLFVVIVGLLVIPIQITFVPMLEFFGNDGLEITGQFLSVWLLHTAFGMPLAIYLLRNYMATLPRSVIESAEVDGATHFQTFWQLIIPMSVPALAAFAIFQFLWVWNDLLIALLFLQQGENEAITVNLTQLNGRLGEGWQLLTAGAFVTMLVPLIVFFSLQRYFVRGLTAGSVKG